VSQKKRNPEQSNSEENGILAATGESLSDFWWNMVYFAILTVAIAFIVVNNDSSSLTSTTGLIILGVLVALDTWPAVYLAKVLVQVVRNNRDEK